MGHARVGKPSQEEAAPKRPAASSSKQAGDSVYQDVALNLARVSATHLKMEKFSDVGQGGVLLTFESVHPQRSAHVLACPLFARFCSSASVRSHLCRPIFHFKQFPSWFLEIFPSAGPDLLLLRFLPPPLEALLLHRCIGVLGRRRFILG